MTNTEYWPRGSQASKSQLTPLIAQAYEYVHGVTRVAPAIAQGVPRTHNTMLAWREHRARFILGI